MAILFKKNCYLMLREGRIAVLLHALRKTNENAKLALRQRTLFLFRLVLKKFQKFINCFYVEMFAIGVFSRGFHKISQRKPATLPGAVTFRRRKSRDRERGLMVRRRNLSATSPQHHAHRAPKPRRDAWERDRHKATCHARKAAAPF